MKSEWREIDVEMNVVTECCDEEREENYKEAIKKVEDKGRATKQLLLYSRGTLVLF